MWVPPSLFPFSSPSYASSCTRFIDNTDAVSSVVLGAELSVVASVRLVSRRAWDTLLILSLYVFDANVNAMIDVGSSSRTMIRESVKTCSDAELHGARVSDFRPQSTSTSSLRATHSGYSSRVTSPVRYAQRLDRVFKIELRSCPTDPGASLSDA
jgi:hypothetical protein